MFNKQLKSNIKQLDLQISKLTKEIEELKKDSVYDVTMERLEALTELRVKLAKSLKEDESSEALERMDRQLDELMEELYLSEKDVVYAEKLKKLEELTAIRCQLADSKVKESGLRFKDVAPALITGAIGFGALLVTLKYEKDDVIITSKGFGMIPKLFRGN